MIQRDVLSRNGPLYNTISRECAKCLSFRQLALHNPLVSSRWGRTWETPSLNHRYYLLAYAGERETERERESETSQIALGSSLVENIHGLRNIVVVVARVVQHPSRFSQSTAARPFTQSPRPTDDALCVSHCVESAERRVSPAPSSPLPAFPFFLLRRRSLPSPVQTWRVLQVNKGGLDGCETCVGERIRIARAHGTVRGCPSLTKRDEENARHLGAAQIFAIFYFPLPAKRRSINNVARLLFELVAISCVIVSTVKVLAYTELFIPELLIFYYLLTWQRLLIARCMFSATLFYRI